MARLHMVIWRVMDIELSIVIDDDVVERYNQHYFDEHPKAYKKPIEHPYHPSVNVWCIKPRIQMNAIKQQWKSFIVWLIRNLGYDDMGLESVAVEYDIYHPTKRRTDVDNYTPKFIHDGFVESGFIVDDDREHIKSLTIRCHVDAKHPRTEIKVTVIE